MQHRKLVVRDDYYIMTDKELGQAIDQVRIALATRQPISGHHIRILEEGARRLHTLVRVHMNDNSKSVRKR